MAHQSVEKRKVYRRGILRIKTSMVLNEISYSSFEPTKDMVSYDSSIYRKEEGIQKRKIAC